MKSLIKIPTCYQTPANPRCIDLMLTDSNQSFQNSCTINTGLSDFVNLKSYELQRLSKIFGEEFRQQVLKDILKTT